jgi:streptogramin lyase
MAAGDLEATDSQLIDEKETLPVKPVGIEKFSDEPSGDLPYYACPPATEVRASCQAVVVPPEASDAVIEDRIASGLVDMGEGAGGLEPAFQGSGVEGGFAPADLLSAYKLTATGGTGVTIAIVDAYGYSNAESDLATFRSHYGLSPCTIANGCFSKINQKGEKGNYPPKPGFFEAGWEVESALDLDTASAICAECNLVLVEADTASFKNLGIAENSAVGFGAKVISNSWGGPERAEESAEDSLYYDHPGIPLLFSSGDSGYGASYPSTSSKVISVGGTSLVKDKSKRGWRESAWSGAGSGCSQYEAKPKWQTDKGCSKRTAADVAAVADPSTPVSVYAAEWEEEESESPGWLRVGGTSASAPILAGIEARATSTDQAKGAELFWLQGAEGKLFDITEGHNGHCFPKAQYLCEGTAGFDGPTGMGTPGASSPGPPIVGTTDPAEVTTVKGTLKGVINPNGATKSTGYWFEFGTTSAYGMGEPEAEEKFIGAGSTTIEVSQQLSGLAWGTTYHYRLVAKNAAGKTYGGDHTFVPSRWSTQNGPAAGAEGSLASLTCASASSCLAVGSKRIEYELEEEVLGFKYAGGSAPYAGIWNGKEWTAQSAPAPFEVDSGRESDLRAVSCGSATSCVAIGEKRETKIGAEGYTPLGEYWNGSKWSIASVPLPADAVRESRGWAHAHLNDVYCASSTSCVAVGEYVYKYDEKGHAEEKPLIESWSGSEWEVTPSPSLSSYAVLSLQSVTCTSTTACVAVGSKGESPLILQKGGGSWSVSSTPEKLGGSDTLRDVSCVSTTKCLAVGYVFYAANEPKGSLALELNGSSWTLRSPDVPLTGISCLTAKLCLGVGSSGGYEKYYEWHPQEAAARVWNGSTWASDQPILPYDATGTEASLSTIFCREAACTALGGYQSGVGQALIERLQFTPENVTQPAITPAGAFQGVPLSTSNGAWTNEPSSFGYQWKRCNLKGSECSAILGATSQSYVPVGEDVGHALIAVVKATSEAGSSAEALSQATGSVLPVGQVSTYPLPEKSAPVGIVVGPDGNLWFTEWKSSKIGKITSAGKVTEYGLPAASGPAYIANGPDGHLWFTDSTSNKIGKITTSGMVTEYALPTGSAVWGITAGPDEKLWFTACASNKIGKITTVGIITEYTVPTLKSCPNQITTGPDGNLWFLEQTSGKVAKATTSGTMTEYAVKEATNSLGGGIAVGPDNNLWFAINKTGASKIGKMTTGGTLTEYVLSSGTSYAAGIAKAADGNLWFTESGTSMVGTITAAGAVTDYALPSGSRPAGAVSGPDNRIWFTEEGTDKIGAIVP